MDNNKKNGLLTKVWGPNLWKSIHFITFGYPIDPSEEIKEKYKNWLIGIGDVMPCKYCRESYKIFINEGYAKLDENSLKDRESLIEWGWKIHNKVNEKLGIDYKTELDDLHCKYEVCRAKCISKDKGCTMPVDLKAEIYKSFEKEHAPVIDYNFSLLFVKYAEKRGLKNYKKLLEKNKNFMEDREDRDFKCWKVIKKMRKDSINCLETCGEYKDLPTLHELILLSMLSSNISKNLIDELKFSLKRNNFI